MIRRAAAALAAALAVAAMACGTVAGSAQAVVPAATTTQDPLRVTIERVTPSTLTASSDGTTASGNETITVSGTVTNVSEGTWSEIHVYPLTSSKPFTTADELAKAAATPADEYIGSRLLDLRDELPETLRPGQSASFELSLPRGELNIGDQAGVYWLGLHILGTEDGARESSIDGRARVFLPLMEAGNATPVSLVLPVREQVIRDSTGRLMEAGSWDARFGSDGRLGRLLSLTQTAGGFPISLLIDPAVVDAADSMATGNEALQLEPTTPARDEGNASDWLTALETEAPAHEVLSLPFGDTDVTSAYRAGRDDLYDRAAQESATVDAAHGITGQPAVAPRSGRLAAEAITGLGPTTPVLLDRSAVRSDDVPTRIDSDTATRIVTTVSTTSGSNALATRQELLAKAAVHGLSDQADQPLVFQLPADWDPGASWPEAEFFTGLSVPWILPTSLSATLGAPATTLTQGSRTLRSPSTKNDLPATVFADAGSLIHSGGVLSELVTGDDAIDTSTTRSALLGISEHTHSSPAWAQQLLSSQNDKISSLLGKVRIKAPTFVTMSSDEAPFQITVQNDLPVPVTVGVRARALSGQLEVTGADAVDVGAEQRRSIRLVASTTGLGEYRLQLRPLTETGSPFGTSTELRIRSSRVGQFIWIGLGVGTFVLVALIVVRVRRRVRARQRTHGPVLKDGEQTVPDSEPSGDEPTTSDREDAEP